MRRALPRLILLNGTPGIGKSTLSALWADRHPGTLNLDIDVLHPLVGGWQHDTRTHDVLRPVALAMAATHLGGGRDVVLPHVFTRAAEVEAFERVAAEQGATVHEFVLMADRAEAVARYGRRRDDSAWGRRNREVVQEMGGDQMLGTWYDQVLDLVRRRPGTVVVPSEPGAVEETYLTLQRALDDVEDETAAPSPG